MNKSVAENIINNIVDKTTVPEEANSSLLSQLFNLIMNYSEQRPEENNKNFSVKDGEYSEILESVRKNCSLVLSDSIYDVVSDMLDIYAEEYFKYGLKCGIKLKSELED